MEDFYEYAKVEGIGQMAGWMSHKSMEESRTIPGFDWLTCGHFNRNNQSRRVVEKCGFQYIKDVIHQTRFGTEEPTKLYVLYNPNKER